MIPGCTRAPETKVLFGQFNAASTVCMGCKNYLFIAHAGISNNMSDGPFYHVHVYPEV